MNDQDRVVELIRDKVAVNLNNAEVRGEGIIGTLAEVHDAGSELSEISKFGPGPTMFCSWAGFPEAGSRTAAVAQAAH